MMVRTIMKSHPRMRKEYANKIMRIREIGDRRDTFQAGLHPPLPSAKSSPIRVYF